MSGILATFSRLKNVGGGGAMTLSPGPAYFVDYELLAGFNANGTGFESSFSSPTPIGDLLPSTDTLRGDWADPSVITTFVTAPEFPLTFPPTPRRAYINLPGPRYRTRWLFDSIDFGNGMQVLNQSNLRLYSSVTPSWMWEEGYLGVVITQYSNGITYLPRIQTATLKACGTITIGFDGTNFYGYQFGGPTVGSIAPYLTGATGDVFRFGYDSSRNMTQLTGIVGASPSYFGPTITVLVGGVPRTFTSSDSSLTIAGAVAYYERFGDVFNMASNVGGTLSFEAVSNGL